MKGKIYQQKHLGKSELPISTRISIHGLNDAAWEMRQTLARYAFFSSHVKIINEPTISK